MKFFLIGLPQLLINFSFNFNVIDSFTIRELCFFFGVKLSFIIVIFARVRDGDCGVSDTSTSLGLSW